jgi:hypothetical protein
MTFLLRGYDLDDDHLVSEVELPGEGDDYFRELLGLGRLDALVGLVYRLADDELARLVDRFSLRLGTRPQEYFLESRPDA